MTQVLAQPAASSFRRAFPRAPRWRAYLLGYGLLVPAFGLVIGILLYPLLYEAQLSLTNTQTSAGTSSFIGLRNYAQILADAIFWQAVRNTALLVGVTTCGEVLLALGIALLLWRSSWLRPLLFVTVFLPWVYPSSFANYTWYWMILPPFHTFYTLDALQARFWLESIFGEQAWQIMSFALVSLWRGSSIVALVLLAGFRAIPRDLLDYARLEISSPLRYFWSVVMPLTRRFTALAVVVALTLAYLEYLAMYVESNGRITVPVLGTLVYRAELQDGRVGYAAALSLLQVPVMAVLVLVAVPLVASRLRRGVVRESPATFWPTPARDLLEASAAIGSSLAHPRGGGHTVSTAVDASYRGGGRLRGVVSNSLASLACLGATAFYLLPLYYTFIQSIKSADDFLLGPLGQPFWAFRIDLDDGWFDTARNDLFWQAAFNTAVVFGSVIVIAVAVSLVAGYALARLRLPGADWLARALFAAYFIPQLAVIVPLLQMYSDLGIENTYLSVVLVYLTMAIPFATWLFYIYFVALDAEVEDHALLDAGRVRVFLSVVLPRTWPVIIAAAVFAIGMMSSDLLYARIFTLNSDTRTLPVTMGSLVYDPDRWADANASILMGGVPLLLIGLGLGRFFVRGLRAAFAED